MSDSHSSKLTPGKKVKVEMPRGKGRLLSKLAAARMLVSALKQLGFSVEIEGAREAGETADGARFVIQPGGDTIDFPFKGKKVGGALVMLGGYVNSIAVAETSVPGGSGLCYLELDFDLDAADDYVYGGTLDSVTVGFGSSLPAASGGTFYIGLFEYDGTTVVSQSAHTHFHVQVCDSGLADGNAVLNVFTA